MNLILWRHAEAEPGADDMARELTHKGRAQAANMAHWLQKQLPPNPRILASPARRTQQTAAALGVPFETCAELATDGSAAQLIAASGWPHADTVVLVGHQPALGELAALLMTGSVAEWSIRKGAVWWLQHRVREAQQQVVLHAMMSPALLASRR